MNQRRVSPGGGFTAAVEAEDDEGVLTSWLISKWRLTGTKYRKLKTHSSVFQHTAGQIR